MRKLNPPYFLCSFFLAIRTKHSKGSGLIPSSNVADLHAPHAIPELSFPLRSS
jgi:hypothetical protein